MSKTEQTIEQVDLHKLDNLLLYASVRPWEFDGQGTIYMGNTIGDVVCEGMEYRTDGNLIVEAVNNLPALIKELSEAREMLRAVSDVMGTAEPGSVIWLQLDRALKHRRYTGEPHEISR